MVIEAIRAGAKDFLVKPYQPDRVLATVKRIMEVAG
jgi:two-component system chemotaxis response regulator CheY